MIVNEIFVSLQGESTFAGVPCIFIRLTGCNLRCTYCDTRYAFSEGKDVSIPQILEKVELLSAPWRKFLTEKNGKLPIVEVTGGEPLVQNETPQLLRTLCDNGYTVLLETNGSFPLDSIDSRVRKIIDIKVPSSGVSVPPDVLQIFALKTHDEIKFVLGCLEDYDWVKAYILNHWSTLKDITLLMSWYEMDSSQRQKVHPISRSELADLIVKDSLPVRLQVQLHKVLWPSELRGK